MCFTATLAREVAENDDVISLLKETIISRGPYKSKFLLLWRENEANCGKRSKLSLKMLWSEPEKYSQQTFSYSTIQTMVRIHILPVQHLCIESPRLRHKILGLFPVAGLLLQGTFERTC